MLNRIPPHLELPLGRMQYAPVSNIVSSRRDLLGWSSFGVAGSLGVGTDLEAGGLASSVVELFSQVDVVDGGWRLGHGGLVLDSDGTNTVVGAQVSIGGATVLGLTSDVELTVGGSHVGVWDCANTV